jgi:TRAP-type uncharacterized transport system substrate-binding protein
MRRLLSALMIIISAFGITTFAALAALGTKEEAIAMAERVKQKLLKDGPEATFKAVNEGAPGFHDRDLFPVITDSEKLFGAASWLPALRGRYLGDDKDQNGKFLSREFFNIAKGPGRGWFDTRVFNPITKTIEDKSIYILKINDKYFVGVGVYKNQRPNENTVGLISGSPHSDDTYLSVAYDLAEVLNDDASLRIVPIVGIGGTRNIRDVRYLRGVDIGLTQTNILNSFRRNDELMGQTEKDKIVYISRLFIEEAHVLARSDINSITQLRGRKVNLDARGSGTSYTMRDVFKSLNIEVEEVSMSQSEAFEKVKSGEIAATVLISGKPVRSMATLKLTDNLRFLSIPYPQQLIADYVPTRLTNEDYPALIAPTQSVETIGVGAVLIAYNWPKTNTDRYRRVQTFVDAFFTKIGEFQKPPHHPKWSEVNVAATLPGWGRFEAAQEWLDRQRGNEAKVEDESSLRQTAASGGGTRSGDTANANVPPQDSALYQEFLRWRQQQRPGR